MVLTDNDLLIPFILYYAIIIVFTWFFISRSIDGFNAFLAGLTIGWILMFVCITLSDGLNITNKASPLVWIGFYMLVLSPFAIMGGYLGLISKNAI